MGNKQTVDCPSVVLTSLDAAGKTTFICKPWFQRIQGSKRAHFRSDRLPRDLGTEVVTTVPTIGAHLIDCLFSRMCAPGFSVETLEVKNQKWTVWDVGTGAKIRPLYWHYYSTADAFTFMVDASDVERFEDNKQELLRLHYDLNKTDHNFDCRVRFAVLLSRASDAACCADGPAADSVQQAGPAALSGQCHLV
jgi:GTPase SAR1 family protein